MGMKPIKVSADSKIHVKVKVKLNDYEQRRCFYGHDSNIDAVEQEADFKVENSSFNGNCTS